MKIDLSYRYMIGYLLEYTPNITYQKSTHLGSSKFDVFVWLKLDGRHP